MSSTVTDINSPVLEFLNPALDYEDYIPSKPEPLEEAPWNPYPVNLVYPPITSTSQQSQYTNILLIDNKVKDYQQFVDSANLSTLPIVYSFFSTRKELLELLQNNFTNISRIGFVFEVAPNCDNFFLDTDYFFSVDESGVYNENTKLVINLIKDFNVQNIDFLGCETLKSQKWVNYYNILGKETGVVVGASNDKTGNINYGGNWVLESTCQDIEAIYFTKNIEYYKYFLGSVYYTYQDIVYVLDDTNYTAYVQAGNSGFRGIAKIPSTLYYNQHNYTVTWLNDGAFQYATNLFEVNMPDTITYAGANVFLGCTNLNSVVLSRNLTSIAYQMFLYCDSLIQFNVPDYIKSVGFQAFGYCSYLQSMILPDTVTFLDVYCFNNCSSMEVFNSGNGVKALDKTMFGNTTALREIIIGDSVTDIGIDTFSFRNIRTLTIGNSVSFIDRSTFVRCDLLETLVIGNLNAITPVTTLDYYAFRNLPSLRSVYIGKSVRIILGQAFVNCANLSELIIEEGVVAIDSAVFGGNKSLVNVTLPRSLTAIPGALFGDCTNLETVSIPDTIVSVGENVFLYCSSLKYLVLPDSVTSIGMNLCFRCFSLQSVTLSNSITGIESNSFYECTALASIEIPNSVRYLQDQAIFGCSSLTSLTIPDSVTYLGFQTLYNLTGVQNLVIGNGVTSLPNRTVGNALSLVNLTIGNSVTFIANDSFYNLQNLNYVKLGNSIITIEQNAFVNSYYIKELHIGDENATAAVTVIGAGTFSTNSQIEILTLGKSVLAIGPGAFSLANVSSLIIPDSIKSIDGNNLGNTKITSIVIPDSVTFIGVNCFYGSANLTSVTIGTGIQVIPEHAFWRCSALEQVNLGRNITAIENGAFEETPALKTVIIEEGSVLQGLGSNVFYLSGLQELNLPDGVTYFGDQPFLQCNSLKNLKIGSGATYSNNIGYYNSFRNLETFELGAGPVFEDITSQQFGVFNYLITLMIKGNITSLENIFPKNLLTSISLGNADTGTPGTTIQNTWFNNCPNLVTLTLGDLVTTIGDTAFQGCSSITELNIGMNVARIKNSMFVNSTKLTNIHIGSNSISQLFSNENGVRNLSISDPITPVTIIEAGAFANLTDLTQVVTGPSVASIGANAFAGCTNLETFVVGDSVTSINSSTFTNCSSLTEITLGKAVDSINGNTFDTCTSLINITVDPENPNFSSIAGVLFNKDVTILLRYPINSDTTYIVPNTVTSIAGGAFDFCVNVTTITIPGSVVSIDSDIFTTSGLTEVVLTGPNVANSLFQNCSTLPTLILENTVETIGSNVFQGCPLLTSVTIPSSVTSIDNTAFQGSGLTDLVINSPSVATTWFQNYSSLKTLVISNAVSSIGSQAFLGCTGLTSISVGDLITNINSDIFPDVNALVNLTIGNFVTNVQPNMFSSSSNFKAVTIGNSDPVTANILVDNSWFQNYSGLTLISLGNGVLSVGSSAFSSATDVQSLTLGNSITNVGFTLSAGFSNLINLTIGNSGSSMNVPNNWFQNYANLKTLVLGDSVTTIADNAFSGCSSLTTINIGCNVASINSTIFPGRNNLVSLIIGNSNANNITTIGSSSFSNSPALTNLIIGNSVINVDSSVFLGCSALTTINVNSNNLGNNVFENLLDLQTLTVGSYVPIIQANMFQGCTALKSLSIYNSAIGNGAFANFSNLTSLTVGSSVSNIDDTMFAGCIGLVTLSIGNDNNATPVINIGDSAFAELPNLVDVIIGNAVASIGDYIFTNDISLTTARFGFNAPSFNSNIFEGCINITDIIVDEPAISLMANSDGVVALTTASTTTIGKNAYKDNKKLTSATISSNCVSIGDTAFSGCTGIVSVTIPSSVTSIGKECFSKATSLATITFTDVSQLKSLGDGAFKGCTSLKSIILPNSITSIGTNWFNGCSGLTSVTIGYSVASIDSTVFSGCNSLKNVILGNDINSGGIQISDYCFKNFTSITSVSFGQNCIASIGTSAFEGCTGLTTIGVKTTTLGSNAFYNCSNLNSASLTTNSNLIVNMINTSNLVSLNLNCNTIPDYAFNGLTKLKSLTLGSIIKVIGNYAFQGCTNITSNIILPESVTTIGDGAFKNCSKITQFSIPQQFARKSNPSSVSRVGNNVFEGMSSLTSFLMPPLRNTSSSYGYNLFLNCTALSKFEFVFWFNDTQVAGMSTWFTGCTSLTTILLNTEANYSTRGHLAPNIPDNAFKNMTQLSNVTIGIDTDYYRPTIGTSAFEGCTGITSLTIGQAISEIKSNAFKGCTYLSTFSLLGGTKIGSGAFQNCSNFRSLSIPSYTTYIGDDAFNGCSSINTTISIPSSVTTIGSNAFYGCSSCPGIVINNSPSTIGSNAFYNCSFVSSLSLGTSVLSIGDSAFYGLSKFLSLTIPDSTTTLGPNCFKNCTGLLTVSIGTGVKSIANTCFNGDNALTSVIIANSSCAIASGTFSNRPNLSFISVGGVNQRPALTASATPFDSNLTASVDSSTLVLTSDIFDGSGTESGGVFINTACDIGAGFASTLPIAGQNFNNDTITGYYTIADSAYEESTVSNVKLTERHIAIGNNSFKNCSSFSTFDTLNTETVGSGFLQNCYNLKSLYIGNSITSELTPDMWSGTGLQVINVGDFNETTPPSATVGANAFDSMPYLKQVYIGNNISSIGDGAFANSQALTVVKIGKNVNSVNSTMFVNSPIKFFAIGISVPSTTSLASLSKSSLRNLDLVTGPSIADSTFEGNTTLLTVEIGASVVSIGANAFKNCSNLTKVYFNSTSQLPTIGTDAFTGIKSPSTAQLEPGVNATNIIGIFDVLTPSPTWPINLFASSVEANVTLSWDPPITTFVPVVSYYTITSYPNLDIFPITTTSTTYEFIIPPSPIPYTFFVTATPQSGPESEPSPSSQILYDPVPPDIVTDVYASVDYLQITVTWVAPYSSTQILYYTITSDPPGIPPYQTPDGNVTSASFYSQTYGTPYRFIVTATNQYGTSDPSAPSDPVIPQYPCFKAGSKILTSQGYKPVEHLRKGDLVKTLLNDYLPIVLIGKRDIYHPASKDRVKDQLYVCSQAHYPEVWEDLVLTGCHSILVHDFVNEEQKNKATEINSGRVCVTDGKYRLPAVADERALVYDKPGTYTIYHLALENDDYYMNYGIYANGLLVETCSKRYLKELSSMELIE